MLGKLFVCATPIGNLGDATLRLLEVLKAVDLIAAEDTRRTRKLLSHFQIPAQLVAYHDQNERTQTNFLVEKLKAGVKIALVSDGGMPAVSDPGYRLIRACIEATIPIEVLPGPSSVLAALVLSGLPTARFAFEGFLPKRSGDRNRRLEAIKDDDRTLIFFEAPKRVKETLEAFLSVLGDRPMALVRELTKVFEEATRETISEVLKALPLEVKGEIVLVVGGCDPPEADVEAAVDFAGNLCAQGATKSKAAAETARVFKLPRQAIYDRLLGRDPEKS